MVDPVMRAAVKSGAYEATWFVLSVVASYRSLGCVGDVPALRREPRPAQELLQGLQEGHRPGAMRGPLSEHARCLLGPSAARLRR